MDDTNYQVKILQENDVAFVIVLNKRYNYEFMEFSHPGSMMIRFYYTAEEKHP